MSVRSSEDQATRHDGRDLTPPGRLDQKLTEYYSARAEVTPPEGSSFGEQWRLAQARAPAPDQAFNLRWGSTAVWGVSLSATLAALCLTLLQPAQQAPQRGGRAPHSGRLTQATLMDEGTPQDAFAWGDGWLEGEEWSLEWSSPEAHDPPPTPLPSSGGREG